MDDGLDLAIRDELGHPIEGRVQSVIVDGHHGELPVGVAEIVETDHEKWQYLVVAPTMRVPEPVAYTMNAYLAFRAILVAVQRFNRAAGVRAIDSFVCPGLATGVGCMSAKTCAGQMYLAYKSILLPAAIGRHQSIHEFHQAIRKA